MHDVALSSSLRTFWRSSSQAPSAVARVDARWTSDHSLLCPLRRSFVDAWVKTSVTFHLGCSVHSVDSIVSIPVALSLDRPPNLQARITKLLRAKRDFATLRPLLARRLRRWFFDDAVPLAARAPAIFSTLQRLGRPLIISDLMSTWLNAWCVSARFSGSLPCRFCGSCGPDDLLFFTRCPFLRSTIFPMLGVEPPASLVIAFCFHDASLDELHQRALAVHIAKSVHNSLRAQGRFGTRSTIWAMALQRFRKLTRDSPLERNVLLRCRPPANVSA